MRKSEIMRLTDAKIAEGYCVVAVKLPAGTKHRLQTLGVTDAAPIFVLNKKSSGDMIVKIRETRLAINKLYADEIFVG